VYWFPGISSEKSGREERVISDIIAELLFHVHGSRGFGWDGLCGDYFMSLGFLKRGGREMDGWMDGRTGVRRAISCNGENGFFLSIVS